MAVEILSFNLQSNTPWLFAYNALKKNYLTNLSRSQKQTQQTANTLTIQHIQI